MEWPADLEQERAKLTRVLDQVSINEAGHAAELLRIRGMVLSTDWASTSAQVGALDTIDDALSRARDDAGNTHAMASPLYLYPVLEARRLDAIEDASYIEALRQIPDLERLWERWTADQADAGVKVVTRPDLDRAIRIRNAITPHDAEADVRRWKELLAWSR